MNYLTLVIAFDVSYGNQLFVNSIYTAVKVAYISGCNINKQFYSQVGIIRPGSIHPSITRIVQTYSYVTTQQKRGSCYVC